MPLRHYFLSGTVIAGLLCGSGGAYASDLGQRSPSPAISTTRIASSSAAVQNQFVKIVDVTNIRKSPNIEAPIVKKAEPGQTFLIMGTVTSTEGNWYMVSLSEKEAAYVASWVVEAGPSVEDEDAQGVPSSLASESAKPPASPEPIKPDNAKSDQTKAAANPATQTIINIIDVTNIREEPKLDAPIIGKAQAGETYPATGLKDDWYSVTLSNGSTAYIASWVVTTTTLSGNVEQNSGSKVFIYHTHNRESWKNVARSKSGSSVDDPKTNITLVGQELGRILQQKGVPAISANDDIAGRLNLKKLSYTQAYAESRQIMQEAKKATPTLSYFFDIHRDADVPYNQTTVTLDGKAYARILFVIGTGNPNYKENAKFAEALDKLLDKKYPGLSRGVLVKNAHQGNGEYNQSLSPGSILLEFGGANNTLEENKLTAAAFADVFAEYYSSLQKQGNQKK